MPEPSDNLTPKKEEALKAYRELGTVSAAMATVGLHRQTWYDWKNNDSAFAVEAKHADEAVSDMLEQVAIKRACDGSDTLIIFLLKNKKREVFGEKLELAATESLMDAIIGVPRSKAS